MKNQEIAKILFEIAEYLEMDEVPFKPYAYRKAGLALESLEEGVEEIYKKGGKKALDGISSVGKNIAEKIEEYLKTGKIKHYEQLKKRTPIDLGAISAIEGMGPKRAKILFQKLGIRNLKELEKAAKAHKIAPLFGFGEKTEKNILEGIRFLKKSGGRFLLGEILPKVKEVQDKLEGLKDVEKISPAGSVRRKKETIGDADFLVVSRKPKKVMDSFVSLPGVIKVWGKGNTKASVRTREGFDMDIRIVPRESYGSALQYFTGSKDHNIATRRIAISKGLKLNEYGVFRGNKMVAGKTEEEVYRALGMVWMPPEIRENQGEVEASLKNNLPELIGYQDISGDLHCHTSWGEGAHSIAQMAETAKAMGYEYLGISDHTKFLKIERGLNEKQLSRQAGEIAKLNKKYKDFRILQGAETNILNDGSIDINDEALKKLDYAIAGIHSNFRMSKEMMTERIIKAFKNPYIKIFSHPTGRLLKRREEYQIDFDKILRAAKEYGVVLEINSYPERLDLNDQNIRRAKEAGVKMVIDTDSHNKNHFSNIELGIAQARRGWAEKKDIINCHSLKKLLEFLT